MTNYSISISTIITSMTKDGTPKIDYKRMDFTIFAKNKNDAIMKATITALDKDNASFITEIDNIIDVNLVRICKAERQ